MLESLYEKLKDEDSSLHKAIVILQEGAEKAQKVLKYYNAITKWIPGLPKLPEAWSEIGRK